MAKKKGKKKTGRSDLKIIRKRRDKKLAEYQQCDGLVKGIENRLNQERLRRERLFGAVQDYNELLIEEDPKGPEAQELALLQGPQQPPPQKEPEKEEEPQSGEGGKDA